MRQIEGDSYYMLGTGVLSSYRRSLTSEEGLASIALVQPDSVHSSPPPESWMTAYPPLQTPSILLFLQRGFGIGVG